MILDTPTLIMDAKRINRTKSGLILLTIIWVLPRVSFSQVYSSSSTSNEFISTSELLQKNNEAIFLDKAIAYGLDYTYEGLVTDGSGISLVDFDNNGTDNISFGTHQGLSPYFYVIEDSIVSQVSLEGFIFENGGSRSLCWVDYDNDGDKDLSISNVNSAIGFPMEGVQKLYNRVNDSTLVDVTYDSGWSLEPFPSYCTSWADYNNDGWLDCYFSQRKGPGNSYNYFYVSNGDGTFTEMAEELGIDDSQRDDLSVHFLRF